PDNELFISRVEKEVIHELTHTFGLTHCGDVNCVMRASHTIGDTDIKSDQLCKFCNYKLISNLNELAET
ncbi:MAG: hypothetical protein JRC57_06760, partial [Deltaproteobacteria bacterium]|nr:hypothetical protein [Deltaproteobacteria bacterium]